MIANAQINNADESIIEFSLFLFIVINGIRIEISTSKIRNIIISIKKFVENVTFLDERVSNPDSNLVLASFFLIAFSIISKNNKVSVVEMVMHSNIDVFIDLFIH